ncbi:hypothetical protein EON65_05715 [archaeon]|nr:MAG: hypothetical protein EON65_05715 [archaeon]
MNTFESLVASFEKGDSFLSTLNAVESMATSAKVGDIAYFMGRIDEVLLNQSDNSSTAGNKRMSGLPADLTPRKRKRVNIYDEDDVTPSTYTVESAHTAKTALCCTMLEVVNGIEHIYLDTTLKRKAAAILKLQATSREIADIEEQMSELYDKRQWWEDALVELSSDNVFLGALETNLLQGELAYKKYQDIREVSGLLYLLGPDFERLCSVRQDALAEILKLQRNPKKKEVANSSNCRRCREYFGKTGPVCWHCLCYEDKLHIYRTQIITSSQRQVARLRTVGKQSQELGGVNELFQVDDDVEVRKFDEGILDGAYIMIMKLLKSFVNRYNKQQFVEISKLELKWVELIVREMYEMEAVWARYLDILKRYDELDQCKLRVQLDMGGGTAVEAGVDSYKPFQLDPELESTYVQLVDADLHLQEAKASLNFYRTQTRHHVSSGETKELSVSSHCDVDDEVADKCIICMESLTYLDDTTSVKEVPHEEMTVVLPCAHRFHLACAVSWIRPYRRCPLCKQGAKLDDIMTVTRRTAPLALKPETENAQLLVQYLDNPVSKDEHIESYVHAMKEDFSSVNNEVKGRWGVKVDAIVTDLMLLLAHPAQAEQKVIIFSQWQEVRVCCLRQ